MLQATGADSLDALVDEAIPPLHPEHPTASSSRSRRPNIEFLERLSTIAARNKVFDRTSGSVTTTASLRAVILRNVLENPGWYTPYTPYQAEIAQGRLEALLNFQTMVRDLTGMEIANASLLDEATAAAEAMTMLHRVQPRGRPTRNVFLVSEGCYPQTKEVLRSRAEPLQIELRTRRRGEHAARGCLRRAPSDARRERSSYTISRELVGQSSRSRCSRCSREAISWLWLLLTPPGEMGADVVDRLRPAFRRADGIRRSPRRILRDSRDVRTTGARPDHRDLGRPPREIRLIVWRCRPANSTYGARRRPRTSARLRPCSRTSLASTRSTTGPMD
jgi:glycine dehydrogenase